MFFVPLAVNVMLPLIIPGYWMLILDVEEIKEVLLRVEYIQKELSQSSIAGLTE